MSSVFTLSTALFDDFDLLPMTKQGLTWDTFDLNDGNGEHTGWWVVGFDAMGALSNVFHFLDGTDQDHLDDAKTGADTWWTTEAFEKRATGWKTDGNGHPYCYVI